MKTRITAFDIYIAAAADILNAALNEGTDTEHLIPERYISRFCELVVNSMWRNVYSAIAYFELFGDASHFSLNLEGYIDTYHEIDETPWCGFSGRQSDELGRCYPKVVQVFREVALDIIEMYLRCMEPYDIERSIKLKESSEPKGTFRNMEHIASLCQEASPTANEVYDIFLNWARILMHYKGKEK